MEHSEVGLSPDDYISVDVSDTNNSMTERARFIMDEGTDFVECFDYTPYNATWTWP